LSYILAALLLAIKIAGVKICILPIVAAEIADFHCIELIGITTKQVKRFYLKKETSCPATRHPESYPGSTHPMHYLLLKVRAEEYAWGPLQRAYYRC
jgi:hypothetical protein